MEENKTSEAAAPEKKPKKVKDNTPTRIKLRDATLERDETGRVVAVVGKCTEVKADGTVCENSRRIKPQDAFQVARCEECQKRSLHRKIAKKRKDRRAAAKVEKSVTTPAA